MPDFSVQCWGVERDIQISDATGLGLRTLWNFEIIVQEMGAFLLRLDNTRCMPRANRPADTELRLNGNASMTRCCGASMSSSCPL